jgi:hypothetical protein
VRAAAKAVVVIVPDVKGGGLLAVEWAQTSILAASPDKPHPLADDLGDADARLEFVQKSLR